MIILIMLFLILLAKENNFYLRLGLLNTIQGIICLQILNFGYSFGYDIVLMYFALSIMMYIFIFSKK